MADYHINRGEWDRDDDDDYGDLIVKFLAAQPDGMAFNAEGRECVFLEFTRQMDSWEGSLEESADWAKKKDIAKNLRYKHHRAFLEEYSDRKLGRLRWTCTQANFTVGVRRSIKSEDFDSRLAGLGVNEKKVREVIATRTVRKTQKILDAMLRIFHMAITTNPEWAKHAVSETLANTSTERYNLFKKITCPISGFDI